MPRRELLGQLGELRVRLGAFPGQLLGWRVGAAAVGCGHATLLGVPFQGGLLGHSTCGNAHCPGNGRYGALGTAPYILVRVTTVSGPQEEERPGPAEETRTGAPADTSLTVKAGNGAVQILKARSQWRWMRDCGSAAIVGGSTVALSLMLGGLPVQQDEFIALEVIYGLLVIGTYVFWRKARTTMGLSIPWVLDDGLVTGALIIETGIWTGLQARWPIEPHTSAWWQFISVALLVTLTGAVRRHIAENHLERLKG